MAIEILAWNLQEGLALQKRAPQIVDEIKQHNADVVMLSDAYWLDNPLHGASQRVVDAAKYALMTAGYDVHETEYDEAEYEKGQEWGNHYMTLLTRAGLTLDPAREIRLGSRNGLSVVVEDPVTEKRLHVVGLHLDDRSEDRRQHQLDGLLEHVDPGEPTAIDGDFNALHANDWLARLLRRPATSNLFRLLPSERKRDIGQRMVEMASGETLARLQSAGFTDVDKRHKPTMLARLPFLDLDHCLVSESVEGQIFEIKPRSSVSDHRATKTTLGI